MDGGGGGDITSLVEVLEQAEERSRVLEGRLGDPTSRLLARQVQAGLKNAFSIAQKMDSGGGGGGGAGEHVQGADVVQERGERRRKVALPRWTQRMRVSAANADGTPDDGYSWRKYGQKDILGSPYPRGYYRCTHKDSQNCPATKLVQRCGDDPLAFDVTYIGDHNCTQKQKPARPPAASEDDDDQPFLLKFKQGLNINCPDGERHYSHVEPPPLQPGEGCSYGGGGYSGTPAGFDNYYTAPPEFSYGGGYGEVANATTTAPGSYDEYGGGYVYQEDDYKQHNCGFDPSSYFNYN